VTAAALILISVGRLHSFFPGIAALRPALLVSLFALPALFLNQTGARRVNRLRGPLGYAMGFIFLWAAVGAPFALYPGHAVRTLLDEFFRTGIIVVVIAAAVRNMVDVRRLMMVYAIGAIAFSLLAGGGGFRAFGGGGYDPNDGALFVVSGIPLVLYFIVQSRNLVTKLLFTVGLLACASAVVMSGSRGGFLALVAVVGFSLFGFKGVRAWVRVAVIATLMAGIGYSATGDFWERMESITDPDDYNRHSPGGRVEVWKRGVGYMAANPVLGVGINNFTVAEGQHPSIAASIEQGRGRKYSAAHSIWVQMGADLGVLGLVALVLMFWFAIRLLWSPGGRLAARGDPDLAMLGEMGRPLVGVLIAVGVGGTFLSQTYGGILWMPFALALSVDKLVRMKARERVVRARIAGGQQPTPSSGRHRGGWQG
jgi:O-antigen ligase